MSILWPESLRRYADFAGRSRRREWGAFLLWQLGAYCLALAVPALISSIFAAPDGGRSLIPGIAWTFTTLIFLALLVPNLAVIARRLHDQGYSAWISALWVIPFVGWLTVFGMMLRDGERRANRWGPDPKHVEFDPRQAMFPA